MLSCYPVYEMEGRDNCDHVDGCCSYFCQTANEEGKGDDDDDNDADRDGDGDDGDCDDGVCDRRDHCDDDGCDDDGCDAVCFLKNANISNLPISFFFPIRPLQPLSK